MYQLDDYDYVLPDHLIAQRPLSQRDQSRLLHFQRTGDRRSHRIFSDLPELLNPSESLLELLELTKLRQSFCPPGQ